MSSSKTFSHRNQMPIKSSTYINFNIRNRARVNDILFLIRKAQTTSILHKLEYHRENLRRPAFRMLLTLLTKELNSDTWIESVYDQIERANMSNRFNWKMPKKKHIDQCCLVIFYYIVSVINKYKICSEQIWSEILNNILTRNKQFYEYLHKKKIILSNETCEVFSKTLASFYSIQSFSMKIKLIELGFTVDDIIGYQTSIKDLEKILFLLKQREKLNSISIKPEKFIVFMNIPEKLSLFLSHFPNYDINQVNEETQLNVLEQLINMKPYIYLAPIQPNWRSNSLQYSSHAFNMRTFAPLYTSSKHRSHPNELVKYRAARIINFLQQLIIRGARLSKPIYSVIGTELMFEHRFFSTSIGTYVLMDLYMNDLYPCESPTQRDHDFVSTILRYIRIFPAEFQEFISRRIALSYSMIYKPTFMIARRENENEHTQKLNDILFQRPLSLKEWCRLKIKDNCSQKDIKQLNLHQPLINYCTYDIFKPNYSIESIKQVVKHRGNVLPRWTLIAAEASIFLAGDNDDEDNDLNEENNGPQMVVNDDDDDNSNDYW